MLTNIKRRIDRFESLAELAPISEEWNQLALKSGQKIPMQSYAWIFSFLKHRLKKNEHFRVYVLFENDKISAILPLVISARTMLGKKFRILRTPSDYHTSSVDLISIRENKNKNISLIFERVFEDFPRLYSLSLSRLVEHSETLKFFETKNNAYKIISNFYGKGAFLKIDGDFDSYRMNLSSKQRRNFSKSARRLSVLDDISFSFGESNNTTSEELNKFMEVEALSWKGKSGSAILKSDKLKEFYLTLCQELEKQGWMDWQFLSADRKIIAGNLSVKFGDSVLLWKLGYDENYSTCSPGSLLFEQLVKRAYESDEIKEINLMTDMGWHKNWKTSYRSYYNLTIYKNSFMPILFGYFPNLYLKRLKAVPFLLKLAKSLRRMLERKKL